MDRHTPAYSFHSRIAGFAPSAVVVVRVAVAVENGTEQFRRHHIWVSDASEANLTELNTVQCMKALMGL